MFTDCGKRLFLNSANFIELFLKLIILFFLELNFRLFNWFLIFERYDRDGSGFLSKGELKEVMKRAGMSLSSSDISKMMQKLDKNNDDKISLKVQN